MTNMVQSLPLPNLAAEHAWVFEILAGTLGLIFLHACFKHLIKVVRQRALVKGSDWRQQLDHILLFPTQILFLVVGFYFIMNVLATRFGFQTSAEILKPFRDSSIILCLSWIALRWKREFLHFSQKQVKISPPGLIHAFNKLLSILIGVLTVLIILRIFDLDIMPLLAFGGIGAAAVGFAAKDVIGNFFGGLMLSITRPFSVGDWIILPEHKVEGAVEEAGWYLTSIRDKDKRPVYLPNAIFSNLLVINASRMTHRRIYETIGVRYLDFTKLASITQKIKEYVQQHPAIDTEAPILIFFHHFSEYSLDIYLDIYTLATRWEDYLAVKEEVLKNVFRILEDHQASMPFPTSTVEVLKMADAR
jgi:MscS family membrane protein